MDWLQDNESATYDELTLIDLSIFPAISPTDTKSGSHTLPVARIPLRLSAHDGSPLATPSGEAEAQAEAGCRGESCSQSDS
jgi:hypothetical protein